MPRQRKIWFRKATGCYYTQINRKKVNLGPDYERADQLFHKLSLTAKPTSKQVTTVLELVKKFLAWARDHYDSWQWYATFLEDFCEFHSELQLAEVAPDHVSEWYQARDWNPTSCYHAAGVMIRLFNWGVRRKLLLENPLARMERPEPQARERILTDQERRLILGALSGRRDAGFKLFLFAMSQTGARPGEVRKVTAAHCQLDAGVWVFTKHKTRKKTKKNRIVYLTPPMVKLCRKLIAKHPTGALFRNSRGVAFSSNAIRCRFRNLRAKFPDLEGVVAHVWRHTFTTEALVNGVPIATVAELLGHSSTRMIEQTYSHLSQKVQYLRSAAVTAAQRPRRG